MDEFIEWYCSEPRLSFSRTVVVRYRMHLESRKLAPGTVNLRLGAVRRLAYEASDCGLLSPDLAAGIRRLVATPIYYSSLPTRVLIGFMMITAAPGLLPQRALVRSPWLRCLQSQWLGSLPEHPVSCSHAHRLAVWALEIGDFQQT